MDLTSAVESGNSPELSPSQFFKRTLTSIIDGSPGSLASSELEAAMGIADMAVQDEEISDFEWGDTVVDLLSPLNAHPRIRERMEVINDLVKITVMKDAEKAELERLTLIDPLTGIYNRRHLDREILRVVSEANRHESDPNRSFVLFDLKKFKDVNDGYGHSTGDEVLALVAMELSRITRKGDVLARYGGDEFGLIANHSGPEELRDTISRIEETVSLIRIPGKDGINIGLHSGSVSLKPGRFKTTAEVYREVDPKKQKKDYKH